MVNKSFCKKEELIARIKVWDECATNKSEIRGTIFALILCLIAAVENEAGSIKKGIFAILMRIVVCTIRTLSVSVFISVAL